MIEESGTLEAVAQRLHARVVEFEAAFAEAATPALILEAYLLTDALDEALADAMAELACAVGEAGERQKHDEARIRELEADLAKAVAEAGQLRAEMRRPEREARREDRA